MVQFFHSKNREKLTIKTGKNHYLEMLCKLRKALTKEFIIDVKKLFKLRESLLKDIFKIVIHQCQETLESQLFILKVQKQKSYNVVHALAIRRFIIVVRVTSQKVPQNLSKSQFKHSLFPLIK